MSTSPLRWRFPGEHITFKVAIQRDAGLSPRDDSLLNQKFFKIEGVERLVLGGWMIPSKSEVFQI